MERVGSLIKASIVHALRMLRVLPWAKRLMKTVTVYNNLFLQLVKRNFYP